VSVPSEPEVPPSRWSVVGNGLSLVAIGLLTSGVLGDIHSLKHSDQRSTAVVLLATAVVSWLAWMYVRSRLEWLSGVALVSTALVGGALAGFIPVALIFPGVAVLSAAMRWPIKVAALIAGGGWLAVLVSVVAQGRSDGILIGGMAAVLGGAVVGITRRDAMERTEQSARIEVAVARTELEHARAELLSQRNHLAREIHDVLAHTLAALSLQLEAFSTVVDAEPDTSASVREQLERTRMLVRDGLDEARDAVSALRDEPVPLAEQLTKLCAQHDATYRESGTARSLPAPAVVGLYRVAQEALTNVMKHAPGTPTALDLRWSTDSVSLTVENEAPSPGPATPLGKTGGGYGLRGIAERLDLLGGTVESGPTDSGWRVATTLPLAGPQPSANGILTA
jgi:signal transduction histidine kinase